MANKFWNIVYVLFNTDYKKYFKSWYGFFIYGLALSWVSIDILFFNYEETIEFVRENSLIPKAYAFKKLLFMLDQDIGKTATIVVMLGLTSIPFVISGYKLRKVIKKT